MVEGLKSLHSPENKLLILCEDRILFYCWKLEGTLKKSTSAACVCTDSLSFNAGFWNEPGWAHKHDILVQK